MKEKSFQFQKLYWSAVSWEISIDTKIPLKAPEHLIVPNRKWCSEKEKHSIKHPKNLTVHMFAQLSRPVWEKDK